MLASLAEKVNFMGYAQEKLTSGNSGLRKNDSVKRLIQGSRTHFYGSQEFTSNIASIVCPACHGRLEWNENSPYSHLLRAVKAVFSLLGSFYVTLNSFKTAFLFRIMRQFF